MVQVLSFHQSDREGESLIMVFRFAVGRQLYICGPLLMLYHPTIPIPLYHRSVINQILFFLASIQKKCRPLPLLPARTVQFACVLVQALLEVLD